MPLNKHLDELNIILMDLKSIDVKIENEDFVLFFFMFFTAIL